MKWLNKLEKTRLLIIDDFGLQELDAITRLALLQIPPVSCEMVTF